MPARPRPPLTPETLRPLALHYVGRYATTAAKLQRYLSGKLRERGWEGGPRPDLAALAADFAERGYLDDAAFAAGRAASMRRRGYGARRIDGALRVAGVEETVRNDATDAGAGAARAAATAFARRRRLGPFARVPADDPDSRRKALAAMLRAGHELSVARAVLSGIGAADDVMED